MLRAAKVLATTQAGDPKRKAAELDFKRAAPKAQETHSRIATLRSNAREARTKLEADDLQRAKNGTAIEAGQRADTKLRMRLRSRLSEAISRTDLLRVWFVTAFGPLPPSRNTNAWLDAATDVLAYRITHQVTDPS